MKKVDVLISDFFDSKIGPMQTIRRIKNSQDFFRERGYEINVFTREGVSSEEQETDMSSSFIYNYLKSRKWWPSIVRWLQRHTLWYAKKNQEHAMMRSRQLLYSYSELKRTPDIIVFHRFYDCYTYLKSCKNNKTKVVYFEHDDGSGDMAFYSFPKAKGSRVEKEFLEKELFVMSNIDVMACITKTTERNLIRRYPVLNGKTRLVINGISDITEEQKVESIKIRAEYQQPKYRLIATGSINGRKGHREIVEALYQMESKKLVDFHVSFLGDGPEKGEIEGLVKKYGLQEIVTFEGIIPNLEVYKYQARCNIAILISKVEGLPLALLEGMRSGLALISTRVSGMPEIIEDGANGLLINPSVDELVNVFNNMNKYDWTSMGVESRKKFDEFYNFARMRDDYVNMLDYILTLPTSNDHSLDNGKRN